MTISDVSDPIRLTPFVEVSAEEWDSMTPEERRERGVNIVRMPDGMRFPVYDTRTSFVVANGRPQ